MMEHSDTHHWHTKAQVVAFLRYLRFPKSKEAIFAIGADHVLMRVMTNSDDVLLMNLQRKRYIVNNRYRYS